MLSENNYVLILKNDAVGDLCQSLSAINNIIENNKNKPIKLNKSIISSNSSNRLPFSLIWDIIDITISHCIAFYG